MELTPGRQSGGVRHHKDWVLPLSLQRNSSRAMARTPKRRAIGAVDESSTVCPALRAVHQADAADCSRHEQARASLRR